MTVPFSGLGDPGATGSKSSKVGNYNIDHAVLSGIKSASKSTGVDFGYLMAQAAQESSFQADARASTSSATGLYQFLDSTWLSMMRTHGAKYGFADMADRIQPDGRGGFAVNDPSQKQKILDLRKDPKVSAVIGAEFALSNKEQLEADLGHKVGSTELYLAHFLGAGGASRFLKGIERNATQPAADLLPQAAEANRAVFYDRTTGRPRTVGDIYQLFANSIESKQSQFAGLPEPQPVAAPTTVAVASAAPRHSGAPAVFASSAPPSTTSTLSAGGSTDRVGASLSLLSILALATLDAPDPTSALNGREADGRLVHSDGRITRADGSATHRDPATSDPTRKRTLDQSI
jgi:soluble lytic murein transglycosylase-like protein